MRRGLLLLLLATTACTNFDALTAGYPPGSELDQSIHIEDLAGGEVADLLDLAAPDDALAPDPGGADAAPSDLGLSCSDGLKGPGETDVDCGGPCSPCEVGLRCATGSDCVTGRCDDSSGRCELETGPPGWVQVGTVPANTSSPPTARDNVSVERGANGNLYVAGGQAGGSAVSATEVLNAGTLSWSTANNLGTARSGAASTTSASTIYVLYGDDGNGAFRTSLERWTTGPNWSSTNSPSYSIVGAGAALAGDGRIYVVGGRDGAGPTKTVKAFDPAKNSFDANPPALSIARELSGVCLGPDGRIYAMGGRSATDTLGTAEAFTVGGAAWVPVAPMPAPRSTGRAVAAPDGRIYVVGGAHQEDGRIYKSVVAYTPGAAPAGDRWGAAAPLLGPGHRHGAAVGLDGRIYVVGGRDLAGRTRVVEAYGPVLTVTPSSVKAGGMVTVSGSNFARNASVRISLDSAAGAAIATATTDGAGVLAATPVTIPAATAAAATRIFATDAKSRYPVSAALTLTP